jgi:acyl-coenzyme A thioesterase PaaI-like protein
LIEVDGAAPGDGPAPPAGPGLSSWTIDGEWRHAYAEIGLESRIEGTDRPHTGVLFAYLDVVTGSPPSGVMNPTVDLQVRLFSPPRLGIIQFTARTLRLGRSLYVGEAEMRHQDEETPFGVGVATFVNKPMPHPDRSDSRGWLSDGSIPSVHRPISDVRRIAAGSFEMDADLHTPQGTVSGATLGRLAELAAVDLLGGAVVVDELDVRFLNKVKAGPIQASAVRVGRRADATTVRIEIVDLGDRDRLVTYALAVCREQRST